MAARPIVLATLLAAPLLAGCLAPALEQQRLPAFDLAGVVAEGATIEALPGGALVRWEGEVPLDGLDVDLGIPAGTTYVEATATWPEGVPGLTMPGRESGPLRRCPRFEDISPLSFRCRGLAVLDDLPATWTFQLRPRGGAQAPVPFALEAVLSSAPLDGPAARIRLDQLSKPVHELLPTEDLRVPMGDGVELFVEVNRPDTSQPVPALLLSTPYNDAARAAGDRPFHGNPYHTVPDYVARGYAVVVADMRGYARSGGCVDVWGPREQQDQYDLVDWIASQPWSDGKVAMYGQSYMGTTSAGGAVMGHPALKTVISIAAVLDPYHDWHFGGVPNGENTGSPVGYTLTGAGAPAGESDQALALQLASQTACGFPQMLVGANAPGHTYGPFYEERNLSARAKDVKIPVLYTHGYFDPNVKDSMALDWFDALPGPKKGFFGPWGHRHPPRADQDLYFHAWFDHWLKGKDTGIMDTPMVETLTLQGTWRTADAWPPRDAPQWALHLDAAQGALSPEPTAAASGQWAALPVGGVRDLEALSPLGVPVPLPMAALPVQELTFDLPAMDARRYLAGAPELDVTISLEGAENTYVAAWLFETDGEAARQVSFGMRNAALRNSYLQHEPVPPGERVTLTLPFQPTEWALEPGKGLRLVVRAALPSDWAGGTPTEPGIVTLHTGEGASVLRLPFLGAPGDVPAPRSARVT